jgi:hypothetical protein
MNAKRMMAMMSLLLTLTTGCAGLSAQQQRILTGGAMGAGAGAAIGAISGGSAATGAAIGGIAGAVGGAVVNEIKK